MPIVMSQGGELLKPTYARRGFLPDADPLVAFASVSPYAALDEIGRDLPSLLHDKGFRAYARALHIPKWEAPITAETLPSFLHRRPRSYLAWRRNSKQRSEGNAG